MKPAPSSLAGNKSVAESIASRVPEREPWSGHLDVSKLDRGSREGAALGSSSQSYYYGAPTNPAAGDSSGAYELGAFPQSEGSNASGLISWRSGVDRRVDPKLIAITERVAREFGRPLIISSGYRSPTHNSNVKGARGSMHMQGKAVDISSSGLNNDDRLRLIALASKHGAIGIGVYNGGSLHFDNRNSARAGWGSSFSYASVPGYAKSTIDKHMAGGYGGGNAAPDNRRDAQPLAGGSSQTSPGYPPGLSQNQIENVIRQEALARNMDPNTAIRVFRSEGAGGYQSGVTRGNQRKVNGREASYGPYQLYVGNPGAGGLGNEYQRITGRDLTNDNTPSGVTNQVRFALDNAARSGWGAWYGADAVGIGPRDGLQGARPINNWN